MPQVPEKLTDPPILAETDALSEVLTGVRLHGTAVKRYAPGTHSRSAVSRARASCTSSRPEPRC